MGNLQIEYTFSNPYVDLALHDGVIFAKYKKGATIDIEAAHMLVRDRKVISGFKPMPLFIDGTQVKKVNREARSYFATQEGADLITAAAIYTNSSFTKILANFLISVNLVKQYTAVKAFDDKQSAIDWLRLHRL